MKKNFMFIFLVVMVTLITGCNNNFEKAETKKTSCKLVGRSASYICPELKNIAYFGQGGLSGYFVDNQGILYEISSQLFSTTNTNCRKVETDVVFEKVIKNTLISKDGSFYSFGGGDSKLRKLTNDIIEKGMSYYGIDQMDIELYKLNNNISYLSDSFNGPDIYVYQKDNNIYQISYIRMNETDEKILHTFTDGEEVISFTNGYVITNKNYYKYGETNRTECLKYKDVECEYGLVPVDSIENCSNDIIYVSDDIVVTKSMFE